jgi:hypothetical protein
MMSSTVAASWPSWAWAAPAKPKKQTFMDSSSDEEKGDEEDEEEGDD